MNDQFPSVDSLGRNEMRHSQYIARMLRRDSAALHPQLGGYLLRRALLTHPSGERCAALWKHEYPVYVSTERNQGLKRWDILFIEDRSRIVVLVENKVNDVDARRQLDEYWAFARERFPRHVLVCLFLTPHGADAGQRPGHGFHSWSYTSIVEAVDKFLANVQVSSGVREELTQYRSLVMKRLL